VWNAGDDAFTGPVRLNPAAFGHPGRWRVEEPRLGSADVIGQAPDEFPVSLNAHSARVFRFVPIDRDE
jgi:hypothetical protein